jgi:predicted DNA-binding transcriptional regulator YafY
VAHNTERLYRIEALIRARGCVSFATLLDELEVSRATLKRDLEYLRSRMGAPIEYDRNANGYRFGADVQAGGRRELPGLWFSEAELYSLLTAQQLLAGLDGDGLLSRHLQPLLDRIRQMLGHGDGADAAAALSQRIRVVTAWRRPVASRFFERVAAALLQRRRLQLRYLSRGRGELGDREVSPQRLVHYRNTWYLDAWCHARGRLLRFALDAVERAAVLETRARDVSVKVVEAELDAGYGIFAGAQAQWAHLLFSAEAAAWVSREQWHPRQKTRFLDDGRFEMKLPYVNETELVMDVLRHGAQCAVVSPAGLAQAVRDQLAAALQAYGCGAGLETSAGLD